MPTKFLEVLKDGNLHTDVHYDRRGALVQFFMIYGNEIANCTHYINIALQTEAEDFLKLDRYLENPYLRIKDPEGDVIIAILNDLASRGYEVSLNYKRLWFVRPK